MVEEIDHIKLLAEKDNQQIEVSSKLLQFSKLLRDTPNLNDVIPCSDIKSADLQIIDEFYQLHNFNEDKEFEHDDFQKKINSNKLEEVIPASCLEFMKKQGWLKQHQNGIVEADDDKFKDTLEACLLLEFKEFYDILLKAIGVKFWCDHTDEALRKFIEKHGLEGKQDPQEMYRIMTVEYPEIFDKINVQWLKELEEANQSIQ